VYFEYFAVHNPFPIPLPNIPLTTPLPVSVFQLPFPSPFRVIPRVPWLKLFPLPLPNSLSLRPLHFPFESTRVHLRLNFLVLAAFSTILPVTKKVFFDPKKFTFFRLSQNPCHHCQNRASLTEIHQQKNLCQAYRKMEIAPPSCGKIIHERLNYEQYKQ
jgi:hypothetical protein